MKVVLANMSNDKFFKSRRNLNVSAKRHGVDEVYSFDFTKDIKNSDFYIRNLAIMSQKRGLGYWLWKPYIILKVLQSLDDNDILIYSDCGMEVIDHLEPVISICRQTERVLLFGNRNYLNAHYTKRDCFVFMDCDYERYWYSMQCDGAFMLFRKSIFAMQFLQEWLSYCENETILTDVPNILGKANLPGFIEHRHDQSILSILAEKYNINLYRMPTHHHHDLFLPVKIQSSVTKEQSDKEMVNLNDVLEYVGNSTFVRNPALNGKINRPLEADRNKEGLEKYNYLISYLSSSYGKLLYHHRNPKFGRIDRLKFKIILRILRFIVKRGYRLERV